MYKFQNALKQCHIRYIMHGCVQIWITIHQLHAKVKVMKDLLRNCYKTWYYCNKSIKKICLVLVVEIELQC